jgi:hypothetical protein
MHTNKLCRTDFVWVGKKYSQYIRSHTVAILFFTIIISICCIQKQWKTISMLLHVILCQCYMFPTHSTKSVPMFYTVWHAITWEWLTIVFMWLIQSQPTVIYGYGNIWYGYSMTRNLMIFSLTKKKVFYFHITTVYYICFTRSVRN